MSDWVSVEHEDGSIEEFQWPFCKVSGCPNRRCLRLNSIYCYPHSMGMKPIPQEKEVETV